MQKSLLPLSITSLNTEALAAHHPFQVTQAAGLSMCGILVTLKPGPQFSQSHTSMLFYSYIVGKNTLWISTWSKLSGTASRVTVKEGGPQHSSVLQQVPLLATRVGVKTAAVSKCQTCSGLPHRTPHPCWQSAAEQRDKLQHLRSQALGWQLTFYSTLACHGWCPVSAQWQWVASALEQALPHTMASQAWRKYLWAV